MVAWGHSVKADRIGECGLLAEVGDIVEVVKGRKYPIGMRMVVNGFYSYRYHNGYGVDPQIVFGGEGKLEKINAENVKIIAKTEER